MHAAILRTPTDTLSHFVDEMRYAVSMDSTNFDAYIFDCDGTLVDSEPISQRVLVDLVGDLGLVIPHEQAMREWAGRDLHDVVSIIEMRLGHALPDDFLSTFRKQQLSRLAESLLPIDGVEEMLEKIAAESPQLPRCVASNAPISKVRLCLEATGLLRFFAEDRLFSAYEIEAWKPKPDLFLLAAERMGVAARNCAVIEDSEFGVKAGLAAEMQVFLFDPQKQYTDDANSASCRVFNSYSELNF